MIDPAMLLQASQAEHLPHSHRLLWDIVYILAFAAGQILFMLKRADLARRSPLNGVKSIRQFVSINWITLVFRAVVEWGVFLWPYRSASVAFIDAAISKLGYSIPFQIPARRGLAGAFFLGIGADFLMDWLVMQKWFQAIPILNKLAENIPQLPEVTQMVDNLSIAKSQSGPNAHEESESGAK